LFTAEDIALRGFPPPRKLEENMLAVGNVGVREGWDGGAQWRASLTSCNYPSHLPPVALRK